MSSLVVRGYKSCVLASREGLIAGTEALRFFIIYIAAYRVNKVVREGFSRIKTSFY